MRTNHFSRIVLVAIISLLFLGLGCKKSSTNSTPTPSPSATNDQTKSDDLSKADPDTYQSQFSDLLKDATTKAQAWRADATLVYVSVKIPEGLDPSQVSVVCVFDSPAEKSYHFTVTAGLDDTQTVRALINKEDYLSDNLSPIDLSYNKVSFLKAFQTAEKNGGADFRAKNATAEITANLYRTDPDNHLYWVVDYKNSSSGDEFSQQINAETGDVVTKGS